MLISTYGYADEPPKIALIIDDMGLQWELGLDAIKLPGAVTYSFLPFSPYAQTLAELTYQQGKELMLHAPMQAIEVKEQEQKDLTVNMNTQIFADLFSAQLNNIPHISGINNHKGSLLTQNYSAMTQIMQLIKAHYGNALFFIDSKTIPGSIAEEVAEEFNIATRSRDIFLDHDEPEKAVIKQQFRKLIAVAQHNGSALGIAHPRLKTLQVLQEELDNLGIYGVQLVPVSALMKQSRKYMVLKPTPRALPTHDSTIVKAPLGEYEIF